jgi:hypothetical protein
MSGTQRKTWSLLKRRLAGSSERELLRLIHDLYDLSVENRNFLHARYSAFEVGIAAYEAKIRDAVLPHTLSDGCPSHLPDIPGARKLIRQYKKASDDGRGLAEILFAFLESGLEFAYLYGDCPLEFLQDLPSVSEELFALLRTFDAGTLETYYERVKKLVRDAGAVERGFPEAFRVHFRQLFPPEAA